jgi:hypothetical protein
MPGMLSMRRLLGSPGATNLPLRLHAGGQPIACPGLQVVHAPECMPADSNVEKQNNHNAVDRRWALACTDGCITVGLPTARLCRRLLDAAPTAGCTTSAAAAGAPPNQKKRWLPPSHSARTHSLGHALQPVRCCCLQRILQQLRHSCQLQRGRSGAGDTTASEPQQALGEPEQHLAPHIAL